MHYTSEYCHYDSNTYVHTVQLEGNLTKTCGWQAKEMRVNLVRVPQIRAGARKGKYPDIRHFVIKMSYYSPICS